jgi:Reverse transcriptase (RNA-dependent DNA polymerase)
VTATQYAEHLDDTLRDLHARLRDNRSVAPPVERVWIEKDDGKQRPIGKPCCEDKRVQRAVVMILEAIFEHDFHAFSHGFRKGHSPHQALHELREQCRTWHINWIVDADVSGFFDNLDWSHLREGIQQRVSDGRRLRLLGKWLHAGVLEAGELRSPDKGTPQGGVISPMLAKVFLHRVLDEWFVKDVHPRMQGHCFLTRFADDGARRKPLDLGDARSPPGDSPDTPPESGSRRVRATGTSKRTDERARRRHHTGGVVRRPGTETTLQAATSVHDRRGPVSVDPASRAARAGRGVAEPLVVGRRRLSAGKALGTCTRRGSRGEGRQHAGSVQRGHAPGAQAPYCHSAVVRRRPCVMAQRAPDTPCDPVRGLQRKLSRAAKAAPPRTFGRLYDTGYRRAV